MAEYNEVPKTYNDFLVLRNSVQHQLDELNTFDNLDAALQSKLLENFERTLNSNIFFVNEALSGQRVTNKKAMNTPLTNTASGKNLSAQHPLFKFSDGSEIRIVNNSNGEFDLSAKQGSQADALLTMFNKLKLQNRMTPKPKPGSGGLKNELENTYHYTPRLTR